MHHSHYSFYRIEIYIKILKRQMKINKFNFEIEFNFHRFVFAKYFISESIYYMILYIETMLELRFHIN